MFRLAKHLYVCTLNVVEINGSHFIEWLIITVIFIMSAVANHNVLQKIIMH